MTTINMEGDGGSVLGSVVGGDSAPAPIPAPTPTPSGRAALNRSVVSSPSADTIVVVPGDDQSPPGNSVY